MKIITSYKKIIYISVKIILLAAVIFTYFAVNREKDFGIDGNYVLIYSNDQFGLEEFSIEKNHMYFNDYEFLISKIDDSEFSIKSYNDQVNLSSIDNGSKLKLEYNNSNAFYINTNYFNNKEYFTSDIYCDLENSSILKIIDEKSLLRKDISTDDAQTLYYDFCDDIIRLTNKESLDYEYYYVNNDNDIEMIDLNGNPRYSYKPPINENILTSYNDLLDNNEVFLSDTNELRVIDFDNVSFVVLDECKLYQIEYDDDIAIVNNGLENYYYYNTEADNINITGCYATDDARNLLILSEGGSGNLTLDNRGINFQYEIYNKYLKCTDSAGYNFLILYEMNSNLQGITIEIIDGENQEPMEFIKLNISDIK